MDAQGVEDKLKEAGRLISNGEHEAAFSLLKNIWLAEPDCREACALMGELMNAVGLNDLAHNLGVIAGGPDGLLLDSQTLFEAGFAFIDKREHELAVMLLERASKVVPHEPTIAYELGFALMSLGRAGEATGYFEKASALEENFDTELNLCACYVLTRQAKMAKNCLKRMSKFAQSKEDKHVVAHQKMVVQRLETVADRLTLSARDWMFVQYGSVLLWQSKEPGMSGKFFNVIDDYTGVASKLLILRDFLEGIGEAFEVIEYYSSLSRPLAEALAELMGLPCEGYKGGKRVERALLVVAWASDIIGPHESFIKHEQRRAIFAYALTPSEPLPVAPDIAGCLAVACAMPWDENWTVEAADDGTTANVEHTPARAEKPEAIARAILEKARAIESDPEIINTAREAVSFYSSRRELVLVGNPEGFPLRPEYTAEVTA